MMAVEGVQASRTAELLDSSTRTTVAQGPKTGVLCGGEKTIPERKKGPLLTEAWHWGGGAWCVWDLGPGVGQ